ncbi:phytoene desaturase family protein [Flavobacterium caeni]|uniref:All-trans-retinol 13,14-reductase n=1 Tax=Flavobacterium caeni TaxID=490189 RepID=A0A1G5H960_9FLAO|nr:NAD(P)/FAD-dependent oxidoreductase [Flavobacterium caeni]SCY59488.1 all-trans-retinol 13,14-reductase [Flavobacterium caeni]
MKAHYDVVVIGSGLGGLVSALILAKEGRRVCVLEKNNQYGGNLQTFVRDKTIFDTGIHYIGGLEEGQNLYRYFKYLGIINGLHLKKMDEDAFDVISFEDEQEAFPHAQGYRNFAEQLSKYFPEEHSSIENYLQKLTETCDAFPLYNLQAEGQYDTKILAQNAKQTIESIVPDKKLAAVLAGSNFLYAGMPEKSPFYVHALSVNSYIQSAWRCINGGSQITKQFIKQLREHGAEVYKYHEVVGLEVIENRIRSAQIKDGSTVTADLFLSNIELKTLLDLVGKEHFRKPFYERVKNLDDVISAFSLYLVFKPDSFPYINRNDYHFKNVDAVWTAQDYDEHNWPKHYMVSMNATHKSETFADGMTILTYMKYADVAHWAGTFNTTAEKGDRGETYEQFKNRKAEILLAEVEKKFPNIRSCIQSMHTSTPLSYRDYIGSHHGSMYGYVRDANDPMRTFVPSKTKLDNLYLVGQSVSIHGVLGVTIGAVATCCEILGKAYLVNKINQAAP